MIPKNQQNRKLRINLTCPGCGMNLDAKKTKGFVLNNETFCCRGCAEGTGCTCDESAVKPAKTGNRPGNRGQRNPENSARDKNQNNKVDSSGRRLEVEQKTGAAPRRKQSHGKTTADGRKVPPRLSKERPSTREQARGKSEFRGAMNSGRADRIGKTGTKSW